MIRPAGSRVSRGATERMYEMPINIDTEAAPIDPTVEKYQQLLGNLQGNILKSHGRDHSVHIFLQFAEDKDTVREGLRNVARTYVTSALTQYQESERYNRFGIAGTL